MGRIIANKVRGMNWAAKISLILIFTLVFSTFMYQGLWKPKKADAAVVTYYDNANTGTNVGIDGITNMSPLADLAVVLASTNSFRVLASTTAPPAAARWRVRESSGATWNGTDQEMFRMYTPAYTNANRSVAANVAFSFNIYNQAAGTASSAKAELYEYNDTVGIVGVMLGSATVNPVPVAGTSWTGNFGNGAVVIANGNRLLVKFYFSSTASRPVYLWGTQINNTTPAGNQNITVTESAAPANTTTVGNGTNPGNANLAPGAAVTPLDTFTLQTSAGTDTVTATTVSLAAGTSAGLSRVGIWSGAACTGTEYGFATNPASDTVAITLGTSISATTTLTSYYVCVTPKTHANMAVPPGSSYSVTGTVTALTSTNTKTYSDSGSATVTIDNLSPGNAAWGTITPGNTQVILNWTNPVDADFSTVTILRRTAAIADVPVEGTTYIQGDAIGTSTVRYVGALATFTDTGLTNGTGYYYKIFAKDTNGNYSSAGVQTGPHTPSAPVTTTVGNGTNPGNASLAPGAVVTPLDTFTLQTSAGTDTVTATTVSLAAGTSAGLSRVGIWSGAACTGTEYGFATNPASDTVAITLGTNISATTTLTSYYVCVTPRTHANMPAVPGASYATTGTVTAITSTNTKTYSDTGSATVTIDNLSPGNAAWGTITPGNTQVILNWTNPVDADFSTVTILRRTAAIADVPVEGTTYIQGNAIGTSTVRYVGALATFTDTGLTNGTGYYYKIFAKDTNGNYSSAGVQTGPHTPAAACTRNAPTVSMGSNGSVSAGGSMIYTVTVTNNDTAACTSSTFTLSRGSETGNTTSFTLPSALAPTTTGVMAPGAVYSGTTLTVVAVASPTVGHTLTTPVNATDATNHNLQPGSGNIITTIIALNDPLLHNSITTSSTKWGGSWGVAGGRYGAFVCETCHAKSTTNIKRIKGTITSPNAPTNTFPGSAVTFTDTRNTTSDFGDDAGAHPTSTKVCEVCHTYDATQANGVKFHAYNMSAGGADLTHNNKTDCMACHGHNNGFKAAGCDTCHGNPPINATAGGPNGLANSPYATGSITAGAHATHTAAAGLNYGCTTCHDGYAMPTTASTFFIDISFNALGTTTGTYDGQTTVRAYSAGNTKGGTLTCSSVYCHSSGQSADGSSTTPVYATPSWTGAAACGSCHAIGSMSTGSHIGHLAVSTNCGLCHSGASAVAYPFGGTHVNKLIDVGLGTYTASGTPGNGYGTCSTATCHDNGKGVAAVTPTWGTAAAACAACHAAAPATDSHTKHLSGTLYKTVICASCHTGTTQGGPAGAGHLDGNIDVSVGSYPADKAKGSALASCTTATCHSKGQSDNGLSATPTTYATVTWGGTAACGSCHAIGSMATGSHTGHLAVSTNCGLCHNGASAVAYNAVTHVDGSIDVGLGTYTMSGAPGNGYGTCSTASCHANVYGTGGTVTPTWGSTGNGCSACHSIAIGVNGPATGSHTMHAGTTCISCHNAGTTATTAPSSEHATGFIDTVAAVGYLDNKAKGSAFTTCSASTCHGTTSPTWGANTATTTCEKCHGSVTTAAGGLFKITAQTTNTAASVIHVSHLASSHNYSSDITCDQCHTEPAAVNDASHIDSALPAEVPMGGALARTGGLTPNYNSGTKTCATMYCHGSSMASWIGTDPNWTATVLNGLPSTVGNGNNTPGSGDCAKCHAYPPMNGAAGTHTGKIATACTTCHTHVNAAGTGFSDATKHINGTVEGGTCNSCHGYESTSWAAATERAPEGKGAHAKHVAHLVTLWGGTLSPTTDQFGSGASWTNVCGVCHNGATHNTGEAIGGNGRQISIAVSHQFGPSAPSYSGIPATSSYVNPKSCSNIDCHYSTTPVWSAY